MCVCVRAPARVYVCVTHKNQPGEALPRLLDSPACCLFTAITVLTLTPPSALLLRADGAVAPACLRQAFRLPRLLPAVGTLCLFYGNNHCCQSAVVDGSTVVGGSSVVGRGVVLVCTH